MADFGLFIGFGSVHTGREDQAGRVFGETMAYYAGLQQNGEIDSFEVALLRPHGGDLGGFILLRGDRDKLDRLQATPEFERQQSRALYVVENVGIVSAWLGAEAGRLVAEGPAHTADLR